MIKNYPNMHYRKLILYIYQANQKWTYFLIQPKHILRLTKINIHANLDNYHIKIDNKLINDPLNPNLG